MLAYSKRPPIANRLRLLDIVKTWSVPLVLVHHPYFVEFVLSGCAKPVDFVLDGALKRRMTARQLATPSTLTFFVVVLFLLMLRSDRLRKEETEAATSTAAATSNSCVARSANAQYLKTRPSNASPSGTWSKARRSETSATPAFTKVRILSPKFQLCKAHLKKKLIKKNN